MADMNVQGGYFAPKNYLKVNTGGSHDENPNGGVQIGMDENGTPNMLEEGEPVYNDFVYSDNIYADIEFLEKYNLPKKYAGKLYSQIADDLFEEYSATPLDPISKNGADVMLNRLAQAQEEQKQIAEQKELEDMLASLSPEEIDALGQQLAMEEQAGAEQQAMQEQAMAQQAPEQAMAMQDASQMSPEMMALPGQAPMMAACGGHINRFDGGGNKQGWLRRMWDTAVSVPVMRGMPTLMATPAGKDVYRPENMVESTVGDEIAYAGDVLPLPVPIGSLTDEAIRGDRKGLAATGALAAMSLLTPGGVRTWRTGKKIEDYSKKVGRAGKYLSKAEDVNQAKRVISSTKKDMSSAKKVIKEVNEEARKAISSGKLSDAEAIISGKKITDAQNLYDTALKRNLLAQNHLWENRTESLLRNLFDPTYQISRQRALNPAGVPFLKKLGAGAQAVLSTGLDGRIASEILRDAVSNSAAPKEYKGETTNIWGYANGGPVNLYEGGSPAGVGYGGFRGKNSISTRYGFNPNKTQQYPNINPFVETYSESTSGASGGSGASTAAVTATAQQASTQAPRVELNPMMNANNMPEWSRNGVPGLRYNYSPLVENPEIAERQRNAYYAANPVDESLIVEHGKNGKMPMLSTSGRYIAPALEGLVGLYDVFQPADKYTAPTFQAFTPSGSIRLVDPRYQAIDIHQSLNALNNQLNATGRGIRNMGLGPGIAAAYLAADAQGNAARGTALANDIQMNEQLRNAALTGANNNEATRAQFYLGLDRYRQQALSEAQRARNQVNLALQQLNNQAESQKWQAISNQLNNGINTIGNIAQENWNMNMVNSNPYFEGYGIDPNGWMNYLASSAWARQALEESEKKQNAETTTPTLPAPSGQQQNAALPFKVNAGIPDFASNWDDIVAAERSKLSPELQLSLMGWPGLWQYGCGGKKK